MAEHGGIEVSLATTAAAVTQYQVVKGSSTGILTATAATESTILGIAQETVSAAGGTIGVRIDGTSKCLYAGTVYVGDALAATTAGKVIATTTAGQHFIGKCLVAGVSGDTGECTVSPGTI
jgi:hypothetical protein